MNKANCGTCRYWQDVGTGDEEAGFRYGECQRYPPTIHPGNDTDVAEADQRYGVTVFPVTTNVDICGEFKGL